MNVYEVSDVCDTSVRRHIPLSAHTPYGSRVARCVIVLVHRGVRAPELMEVPNGVERLGDVVVGTTLLHQLADVLLAGWGNPR